MADNWLGQLAGQQPHIDSAAQLRAAQAAAAQRGTPEQEALARKAGFKSYNEMLVYTRQKQDKSGGSVGKAGQRPSVEAGVNAAKAMHPASMFQYIMDALSGALGD